MKNTISEPKNTEGIKSRLDEAEEAAYHRAGGQGRKKHPVRARKGKETQKVGGGVKGTAGQHET